MERNHAHDTKRIIKQKRKGVKKNRNNIEREEDIHHTTAHT